MIRTVPWRTIAFGSVAIVAFIQLWALVTLPLMGYDSSYHIFWIDQWHQLWQEGVYFPRWLPGSFNGLGAPTFYFYGPLPYFISSALFAVFSSLTVAAVMKLVIGLTLAASGATMWLYLRARGTSLAYRILAVAIYTFAPYRFFDHTVRAALSEHVSFIFVPLVFWGLELIYNSDTRKSQKGILLLAVSLAGLLITNFAAFVTVMLGVVAFTCAVRPTLPKLGKLSVALAASVLLAAFQVVPTLSLSTNIQLGHLWIAPSVIESSPIVSMFLGKAYTTNAYNFLGFLAIALLLVAARHRRTTTERFIVYVCATILFLDLPYISRVAFNFLPVFKIIQRPERLGILITFVFSLWIAHGAASPRFERSHAALITFWSASLTALIIFWAVGFHIHKFGPPPIGETPGFATKWSRVTHDASAIQYANFGDTLVWPGTASMTAFQCTRSSYNDSVTYTSAQATQLTFRRHFWPTWQATVDGVKADLSADSLGRATLIAPAGSHAVLLQYQEPSVAAYGFWISTIAALAIFAALIAIRFKIFGPLRDL